MSKKKINNRLENLFSNITNQEIVDLPSPESIHLQNWTWEADANGIYTSCSPEVTDILGLNSNDFLGSPLLSCHIINSDRRLLLEKIQQNEFPFELELHMDGQNGTVKLIRFHVSRSTGTKEDQANFLGYSQLIETLTPENGSTSLESDSSENNPVTDLRESTQIIPAESENFAEDIQPDTQLTEETSTEGLDQLEKELTRVKHTERVVSPPIRKKSQTKNDFSKLSKTAPLGPLPSSFHGDSSDETGALYEKDLKGIALEGDAYKTSENVWTQQALVSFKENVVVSSPASNESPAILASPLHLQNRKTGVIEIIDGNPDRKWSEEDRLLMQEIANQLGLALENAQLYSAVQTELGERIKAEQLTERRNRDLSTLNQIGQRLSRLVTREEIFNLVTSTLQESIGNNNILFSIYDSENDSFEFPVCLHHGNSVDIPARKCRKGYQESLLKSHAPLVLNRNPFEYLEKEEFDHPIKAPVSMVAVPLMTGDRGLGVISLFNDEEGKVFDHNQVELISTVATQAATSLENATLFENISNALQTIEGRERYQSNVTSAVALLSEKGSTTLPQILEYLANAANCERTFYAEPKLEKDSGLVWTMTSAYTKPDANVLLSKELLSRLVASEYPEWLNDLSLKGWHAMSVEEAKDSEKSYLATQNISSLLLLAIPRGENRNGFIAFENFASKHDWKKEEIDILRIASDAITNTLIREELLNQVQTSLEETENLYSASHQLALSNTMQEMLFAMIQGVHTQTINRGVLILFDYNESDQIDRMVVEANYYSGTGTPPSPVGTEYLVSLYNQLFVSQNPIFYDDVNESQIEKNLQDILIRQNIHSTAVLPLWSGSHQIGALMLISMVKHHFSDQELRSLPPLADQMATAIENLRLYESTQEALSETELLYKISNGISQAHGMNDLIELVGKNAMPNGADAVHLFIANSVQNEAYTTLAYAGFYTKESGYLPGSQDVSAGMFSWLNLSSGEPVSVQLADRFSQNSEFKEFFTKLNCVSLTVFPMLTSGALLGFLIASANHSVEFDKDQVHTLQVVTNSIAVGIERQRLLSETQRRAVELQAAAELARDTASTLSLDTLLNRIVNLVQERFNFYQTAIYLMDESNSFVSIRESAGPAAIQMKRNQYQVAVGSKSAVGACTSSGTPELINDSISNSLYSPNPLLPDTRSELALPLKISDRITGCLDLHSNHPNAFSTAELTVFQILADQISIAIENAHAYELSQQAVDEMRELDRVKNQFLANMSHELRTPLNSVIGFSRVILKGIDGPINETQKQDINSIYNSGLHLLNMINEILDMSKIEAGKMELQLEPTQISDVINSTVSTAMGLVKDKPVQLIQKVAPDLPTVEADQIRVGQVLTNLIANAVKFTEKGSITIGAKRSTSQDGKPEILVTVTDTGIGIAPEDRSKLFQRFSQVDDSPTRKTGGTGLGLSICRSLIELHKGRIGLLNSEVGKGSTFFFTLPLETTGENTVQDQIEDNSNIILAVDDDAQVIALYERYLKNNGYQVIPETDPEKAVERAASLKPMAITLDIMMPKKDGWQVIQDLKKNDATKDIPVLICSILEEDEKGFSLGASDYLVKPFVQEDLIKSIHRMENNGQVHEILLIDDDPADLRLTQKMLENGGSFHVTTAENGRDGLELLTNLLPDLLILDLFMPGLNGFDLLEILRGDPKLNQLSVIILTGADLSADQQKQLSEFGKHLFNKGALKEKELLKYIEDTLNKIKSSKNNG